MTRHDRIRRGGLAIVATAVLAVAVGGALAVGPLSGGAATDDAPPGRLALSAAADGAATTAFADWPEATGTVPFDGEPIQVDGEFDGGLQRFTGGGDGGQGEGQDPVFEVADGGVLRNVIVGAPGADGIHCAGTCTLSNVWWEDVGEDAATFRGSDGGQVMTVEGGGARAADDKVFQHNGAGTLVIRDFQVEDFGKLYRSCGNCSTQFERSVVVENVLVTAPGGSLVGINTNFGDTARLSGITVAGDPDREIGICDRFTGNDTGDEPEQTGSGADGTFCRFDPDAIVYQ
jgi:hypothetical protein